MSPRVLVVIVLSAMLAGVSSAHAQILPVPLGWQLERAVLLSRHGVRAPAPTNQELDRYASTPWPNWPVAPGYLTPRGGELMALMGRYYRVLYGGRGLVQTDDCPAPGTVAGWADVDQRTRISGAMLLAGMYPRCPRVPLGSLENTSTFDPLFHPPPSASRPRLPASNRAAILPRIGDDFTSVTREYSEPLAAMAAALCPTGTSVGGQRCASPTTLSSLEVQRDGRAIIKGPVGVGSTAAENFLMEAAEGWPKDQVAWGRLAGDSELVDLLSIHRLEIDLTRKTLPIARQQGSNMLAQIVETLVDGHRFPGLAAGPEPIRFALLMGHDTNISHIESMLWLGWHIPGNQANDASPGGALAFELYSEVGTNQRYVRLAYYAQTLQQMRQAATLSLNDPPGMQAVDLPGCAAWAYQRSCPLAKFVEIARAAIDPGCVSLKP